MGAMTFARGALVVATVVVASLFLLWWGRVTHRWATGQDGRLDRVRQQGAYQSVTLLAAGILAAATAFETGWPGVLRLGDMGASASYVAWMGFGDADGWGVVGPEAVVWPLVVTTVVVWLQVVRGVSLAGPKVARRLAMSLAWSLPFAAMNALSEELIFRAMPVQVLSGYLDPLVIAVACGVLFGVPHWFGTPGKVPGVLMAGFLGWVMAQSVLDTGGLGWAWLIHVAQDVPIIAMQLVVASAERGGRQTPSRVPDRHG
jgi:membrane protease YdiL (CAAX protease family)